MTVNDKKYYGVFENLSSIDIYLIALNIQRKILKYTDDFKKLL